MRYILFFSIVVLPKLAGAQLTISLNSGVGTFQLNDLKSYQQKLQSFFPVNTQITSSFPAYFTYDLTAINHFENNLTIGASLSHGSTGGRISYSDYSGSLWSDQLASFYSITALVGKGITLLNGRLRLHGDLRPGITITNLKVTYNEVVGTSSSFGSLTYHAANFIIQPTVNASYYFGSVAFNAYAGYNLNLIQGELQADHQQGAYIYQADKMHADWSGVRAGIGLGVKLNNKPSELDHISFGLGLGLDYGGIGMNLLVYPHENVGVFAGVGYALAGIGTNGGIKLRLINPEAKIHSFLIGMYGYNAGVAVFNSPSYNKLFYGPSVGFGIDLKSNKRTGYWTMSLLVPVRGSEVDGYINYLKSQGINFQNILLPFTLSAGFRFTKK